MDVSTRITTLDQMSLLQRPASDNSCYRIALRKVSKLKELAFIVKAGLKPEARINLLSSCYYLQL